MCYHHVMNKQLATPLRFSDEAMRIAANLQQRHDAWVFAIRAEEKLPSSLFWVAKGGVDYLTVKNKTGKSTTVGSRNAATEARYQDYLAERESLHEMIESTEIALREIVAQYRTLGMPLLQPKVGKILREMDIASILGTDVMVVGTNAFCAYELASGIKFMGMGMAETEDFDLAWCRGSDISMAKTSERPVGSSLMKALKNVDQSFRINDKKPFQALDKSGYEVELLVAPSLFKTLSRGEVFSPMAVFDEQEWLLMGSPIRQVVATTDNRTCPIFAPDPRYMGLLKLWLAEKPERNPNKKGKDRRQGDALLSAVSAGMEFSHPMDTDFILSLPNALLPYFDRWASEHGFSPANAGYSMR